MTTRQLRVLRGGAAASVAVIASAAAHTLAGGGAPSAWLMVAAVLLAWPLAAVAVGRRLTVWGMSLAVLVSQALFHVAFALVGTAAPGAVAHLHHGALSSMPMGGATLVPDAQMTAHHLVAALVTVIALHRGERMLRAIARGIVRLLPAAAADLAPLEAVSLRLIRPAVARVPQPVHSTDIFRRGPPER
ncbi:hypothetical protein ACFQRL_03045 [Microbacterium fluvii]|uniref:Uncharacterized protein n=1 Tax=Microbacterium fluvii TaxID=415215 RepID=A0ABW2HBY0_9MICO|nr:hypothetical protein [Microbacterium fluvii]MCU4671570.1 hypothetical protein [Microbacterium fluvii]